MTIKERLDKIYERVAGIESLADCVQSDSNQRHVTALGLAMQEWAKEACSLADTTTFEITEK